MEIESKYAASEAQYEQLLELNALGIYKLEEAGEHCLIDHYMDTKDGDILKGGYACRIREKSGQWIFTLKGLGGADGAIHQREEYEVVVQLDTQQQWPNDSMRDLMISLARSKPLSEIFTIRQHRALRKVYQFQRFVGEMSLDSVDMMMSSGQITRSYEIEIELKEDGTLDDLRALDKIMQSYDLQPEPRSKFERAMANTCLKWK